MLPCIRLLLISFDDDTSDAFKEILPFGRSIEEEGLVYNGYALSNYDNLNAEAITKLNLWQ